MKQYQVFDKKIEKLIPKVDYMERDGVTVISFSQLQKYWTCPKSWKLRYVDKINLDQPNIHLLYGTAIHEVIQWYLKTAFTESAKKADQTGLEKMLLDEMKKAYKDLSEQTGISDFVSLDTIKEYWKDGCKGLEYLKKKRPHYFSSRNYELVAIELPLYLELRPGIFFLGYIDLVLRDKRDGTYIIFDIKTSKKGWKEYKKKDKKTTAQLVLYRMLFSKIYQIPIEKIKVQYFIIKKEINEESEWPQKRIQEFEPSSGVVTQNQIRKALLGFLDNSFLEDGSRNSNPNDYKALLGFRGYNCTFCPYNEREDLCPKSERLTENSLL